MRCPKNVICPKQPNTLSLYGLKGKEKLCTKCDNMPSIMDVQTIAAKTSLEDFLSEEQLKKLAKWKKKKKAKNEGAIGGRYTYSFTPTGLGYVIKVRDNIDKNEIDLTDVEDW